MYTNLSISERLKDLRVVDKHLTLEQLAEQTGLSKSALGKYESDDYKDISPFAIATLAKFYGVSTDYLMGLSENKNHPNTELQALHLSDKMVALLSSGKINNRLLCEIATHENFQRLMTDIEIYVDRIADMRIAQMNLVLEATRQEVLRSHAPGKNDLYVRTLELGQVQESDFWGTPKFCVKSNECRNRANLYVGGSGLTVCRLCLQHNAGGDGCQGRRSRSFNP